MSKFVINSETIIAIADAIRRKTGKLLGLSPADMPGEIDGIMTGFNTADATAVDSDILSGKTAYNGSGKVTGTIQSKSSSDLIAIGATVTVPAGYYSTQATKDVATATQATPSISVSSSGLITASATQTAGYVSEGTKSGTKQLTTQAAKTVTPSSSSQTAVASGVYTTGAVTVAAIPSNYKQIQTTSGTFTTNRSGLATVNCGFKPDVVRFTINHNWDGWKFEGAIDFASSNADKIICTDLYDDDDDILAATYSTTRTDTGFTVEAGYRDYTYGEGTLKNQTVTYSAVKYT